MTSAAITTLTTKQVSPFQDMKMVTVSFTKVNATDYIDFATLGIKNIIFASVRLVAGTGSTPGLDDPCTFSTDRLTMSVGTGTAVAMVVGTS